MDLKIWDLVLKLANKSLENLDVPIGAVIVKDGKVIANGYNTREKEQNVMGHAEVNAILDANKVLNNWNLMGCDMYVSLKPCSMCMEIIKQSRISNVYYLLDKPMEKKEYNKIKLEKFDNFLLEKKYAKEIGDFFKNLRVKE